MANKISRPEADKNKITFKNDFELCYIRHRYLRKTTFNPTQEQMAPYMPIVKKMASRTYFKYKALFDIIGFYIEDITSIGQIHVVNFLGLFSIESDPAKYAKFRQGFMDYKIVEPEESDILSKNKANFTMFLKQRMEDIVRICRQKGRNIRGTGVEHLKRFVGTNTPPRTLDKLLESHGKYGYRKVDAITFRAMKKKAKTKENIFQHEGKWYVAVPIATRNLNIKDFASAGMDPYDNIHNMTPDRLLEKEQQDRFWSTTSKNFKKLSKEKRAEIISSFVQKNVDNPMFKDEVKTAKRVLERMGL